MCSPTLSLCCRCSVCYHAGVLMRALARSHTLTNRVSSLFNCCEYWQIKQHVRSFIVPLCYKLSICAHTSVLIRALARSHTYMARMTIAPVSDAWMLTVYTDAGYTYIYVECRLHVFTHTGSSGKGSIHSSVLHWSASELIKGTQPYSAPVCVNHTTSQLSQHVDNLLTGSWVQ